jgi:hypothetical protein
MGSWFWSRGAVVLEGGRWAWKVWLLFGTIILVANFVVSNFGLPLLSWFSIPLGFCQKP